MSVPPWTCPLPPANSQGVSALPGIRRDTDVRMLVFQVQQLARGLGFSAVGATQLATAA
ncbi:hypothetical protein [Chromobacterium sphagni]|uniref:hypothetical protein n=1 Tax=Chromobacterium sphagni TaxID=1903179 RepID=UPI001300E8D2|nr:hypothetical protein [Chromobacterium sphagni]